MVLLAHFYNVYVWRWIPVVKEVDHFSIFSVATPTPPPPSNAWITSYIGQHRWVPSGTCPINRHCVLGFMCRWHRSSWDLDHFDTFQEIVYLTFSIKLDIRWVINLLYNLVPRFQCKKLRSMVPGSLYASSYLIIDLNRHHYDALHTLIQLPEKIWVTENLNLLLVCLFFATR